jgi:hypothetical protein
MAEFVVPIVKQALLPLWRDYWTTQRPSKEAIAANGKAALGQTYQIKAKNKAEAAAKAEAANPGYVVIRDSIERIG